MPAVRVVLLMGVSASGKSAVGEALAQALGWAYQDADDSHSDASLAKMARGEGLTDADRAPWLARLAALVDRRATEGPPTVLACSALKQRYRDTLGAGRPDVAAFWLDVPTAELARRLGDREGHVAGPDLLPSQLAAFEPPASGRLDGTRPIADLVADVTARLAERV
ncbi:gluconokinase [Rubrivirga sp. IMCC45206]|uniref:gluconokinase n=1 Tax=Rubrivirga sp. IMCC45206 TaxID=3391614 RepID=UPI00398FCF23